MNLFDVTCLVSIAGIWPRFVEPNLLRVSRIAIPNLLQKFTILQLSDLHLNPSLTNFFLNKIISKTRELKPDMIVFTGDFLCRSEIGDKARLQQLLSSFKAPSGCFAILGNHDYSRYISINRFGDYDLQESSSIPKITWLLRNQIELTSRITERAKAPPFHPELIDILEKSPFQLLHNETRQVAVNGGILNVCGLGEYMAGHFDPERAFEGYDPRHPGIVLAHNPDTIPHLKAYPGDLLLCGHTHGGQINLPFFLRRLTPMENPQYKRGLKHEAGKWIYTNRGLGGVYPIRCFSPPEMTLFSLETK